jgi:hypothetical protein
MNCGYDTQSIYSPLLDLKTSGIPIRHNKAYPVLHKYKKSPNIYRKISE